jgi:UPF0716 protein FxsA
VQRVDSGWTDEAAGRVSDGIGGAGRPAGRRRRPRAGAVILALFLVVPLVELAIAIEVGRWIGAVPTILLLLFESFLGAWIVRREGGAAWRALVASAESGKPPTRELADAVLVLIGGTLLLTPGFLTDIAGFVFVIPVTRALVRRPVMRWLGRVVARRFVTFGAFPPGAGFPPGAFPPPGDARRPGGPDVVEGEVVEVDVQDLPNPKRSAGPEGT